MAESLTRYGSMLRSYREDAGITLRELARQIDCSAVYLSDVELGKRAGFDGPRTSIIEVKLGIKSNLLHRAAIKDFVARKGYIQGRHK